MIKITKNHNFPQYFHICIGGFFYDQVKGRAKAMRLAKKLCDERDEELFMFEGFVINKNGE